ncbi:hypothetical protein BP6252_10852 [Coleophoma cylindrospora]|uniref:Zn(2)-C6 fungal-type domain-containing protein n=1 Tax=Coleophoma cylindrospora TaxID=1849047 RepID=A0A3D8QND8_9HELO|nr:hypothetical protein BP6252_10852 [Coleophoma cylindrospora]
MDTSRSVGGLRSRAITKACSACHRRKIKCDGTKPICGQCRRAGAECQPHERAGRAAMYAETVDQLQQRVRWLESEIAKTNSVPDLELVPTGTPLHLGPASSQDKPTSTSPRPHSIGGPRSRFIDTNMDAFAAEIGVLSLNAIGEMRFQGSLTGIVFCKLVTAAARKLLGVEIKTTGTVYQDREEESFHTASELVDTAPDTADLDHVPPRALAEVLLQTYINCIHVTYPIFHTANLDALITAVYTDKEGVSPTQSAIFHLIMALGAIHQKSLVDDAIPATCLAAKFFTRAMAKLDYILLWDGIEGLQVVLLLSMYASYRPSGSSQWHLLGIAMRICVDIGLHRQNRHWNFTPTQWDIRRRLFWTTYAMDRMVCFNIGRPSTLLDDHIDASFPDATFDRISKRKSIALAIHHVKLRQIQSRLTHDVYAIARPNLTIDGREGRLEIISNLQDQLEAWRIELYSIYEKENSPYSLAWYDRLYHTTTLALHRPTPLLPIASDTSLLRCYSSSAALLVTYHESLKDIELAQSWMLLNGCFFAGVTMLYAIWSSLAVSQSVILDEVMDRVRMCSVVLAVMAERWNAASEFRDTFEQLANPTIRQLVRNLEGRTAHTAVEQDPTLSITSQSIQSPEYLASIPTASWDQNFRLDEEIPSIDINEFFEDILRGRGEFWDNVSYGTG